MKLPIFTSTFVQKLCCFTDLSPPYAPPSFLSLDFVFQNKKHVQFQPSSALRAPSQPGKRLENWCWLHTFPQIANTTKHQPWWVLHGGWSFLIMQVFWIYLFLHSWRRSGFLMGKTPKKEFARFQNGSSLASLWMSGFFWNLGSLICWRSRIYHANSLQSNILEPSLSKQNHSSK